MRLYLVFIIIFFLIVIFSEMLPARKELFEMYRRLNDIVRSTGEQINLDIYYSKNQRIEFADSCGLLQNHNATLYLKKENKSSMTKTSIELIARAIAARNKNLQIEKYLQLKETMTNYAEMAGMIS